MVAPHPVTFRTQKVLNQLLSPTLLGTMALVQLTRSEGILLILVAAFVFVLTVIVRRRYFSTISDIPGPFLGSFSVLWEVWSIIQGDINWREINLHRKYGTCIENSSCSDPGPVVLGADLPIRLVDLTLV